MVILGEEGEDLGNSDAVADSFGQKIQLICNYWDYGANYEMGSDYYGSCYEKKEDDYDDYGYGYGDGYGDCGGGGGFSL